MCALKVIVALILNECFRNIKGNGFLNWVALKGALWQLDIGRLELSVALIIVVWL